ncbi:MAG: ATP-dependent DNA helicase [Candidatus Methanospirareceae archaeon]
MRNYLINNFFPFSKIREGQREFMEDVAGVVEGGDILFAHAPTGIGKTVAALTPSLQYAIRNDKMVFFLTPKRTQHKIAVDTLRLIKRTKDVDIRCVDVISKQAMCPRRIYGVKDEREYYSVFNEFCKIEQKMKRCRYFLRYDEEVLERIREEIMHVEELCDFCIDRGVCPHKTALEACKEADVLICDYNYLFDRDISENVLDKIGRDLEDIIVIVDEAHNLPDRIRANLSSELRITTITAAARAIKAFDRELYVLLMRLEEIFRMLAKRAGEEEMRVEREYFEEEVERALKGRIEEMSYDEFVFRLKEAVEEIEEARYEEIEKENAKRNILSVAKFLEGWKTEEECSRIFSNKYAPTLSFKLFDPSLVSENILKGAHSTIMMSGTLCPTEMYADILGATSEAVKERKEVIMKEYRSPFPKENRLIIVTKGLTTKYKERGEGMYKRIAEKIGGIARCVEGGMAVFFPSYELLDAISRYLPEDMKARCIIERREMGKRERNELYERLKEEGGFLLGVQGGSLSEGIDYASNILKAVVIVGLPLSPPTLEVKDIERYYKKKFGEKKGRLYGYIYPAITKVLQAAGRGIRSETDRCMIVLMDYRFAQMPYRRCFPADYDVLYTDKAEELCRNFFFDKPFFKKKSLEENVS